MAIVVCPHCEFEFSVGDPLNAGTGLTPDGWADCPACRQRVDVIRQLAAARPATPAELTRAARGWIAMAVLFTVAGDAALVALLILSRFAGGASPSVGQWVLAGGLMGHALLSLAAEYRLWPSPRAAMLLLRGAVFCWLIGGGVGLASGGLTLPARIGHDPTTVLTAAVVVFVLLLGYLRTLEYLSARVGRPAASEPTPPRPIAAGVAAALLVLHAAASIALGILAWRSFDRGAFLVSAFQAGTLTAIWMYLLLGSGGLLNRTKQPADAARALPRAAAALTVAALLAVLGQTSADVIGRILPGWLAAMLSADVAAVWLAHWRLTPLLGPEAGLAR
ncbi:MAG: hypothetical protein BIFFINMI_04079 [Phycisphaerae bacterium]|nr:hypothetical protein [Phycisphaerae bacterium]